jgi:hypothetical protein
VTITSEAYRAALEEAQAPGGGIELILYLFGAVLDGRNTPVAANRRDSDTTRTTSGCVIIWQ